MASRQQAESGAPGGIIAATKKGQTLTQYKVISLNRHRPDTEGCHSCASRCLCLTNRMSAGELSLFDAAVRHRRPLRRGQFAFRAGDSFEGLYIVRSGSFKSYCLTEAGELQVTGFYLPGEILGADGIDSGAHQYNAEAMDTSSLCRIPSQWLQSQSRVNASLSWQLLRALGRELQRDRAMLFLLGKMSAKRRLANFLIDISSRLHRCGFAGDNLRLGMMRSDIASYLGLAVETVSRGFTYLNKQGILQVKRRSIEIRNMERLKRIASQEGDDLKMANMAGY